MKLICLLLVVLTAAVAASAATATTNPPSGNPDVLCGPSGCGGGGGGNCHGYSHTGYAKNALPGVGSALYGTVTDSGSETENVNNGNHVAGALNLGTPTGSSNDYWIEAGIYQTDGGTPSLYVEVNGSTSPLPSYQLLNYGAASYYTAYPVYIYNEGNSNYIAYVGGHESPEFHIPGFTQSQYVGEANNIDGTCNLLSFQFASMQPWATGNGSGSTMYSFNDNNFGLYMNIQVTAHGFWAYG